MRDIRSNRRENHREEPIPEELPPEARKLYEKHRPKKSPVIKKSRFSGSKVPVASVHVPRQQAATRHKARSQDLSAPAQDKPPLFAIASSKKTSARLGHKERQIMAVFGLLVLLLLGLAATIFLPKATIALTLQTAPLLVDQQLVLSNRTTADPNVIPGTSFEQDITVNGTNPVISSQVVGEKASGVVTLVNQTSQEQPIREQSRLITKDGVLFLMQKHAILQPNSTATVEVEAAEPGPQGNIESGRLTFAALDASAASVLYAEVNRPITGGSGDKVLVVQESDLGQAREAAGAAARQKAEEEIRRQLPKGWVILEESWSAEAAQFNTSAAVGQQIDAVAYDGTMNVRVMAYEEAVLKERLQAALESRLDEDYMLFPGPISFTKSVDSIDWDKGEGNLTVRVTHTTVPNFSLDTLKEKLAGRPQDEAEGYLQGLRGVESASIDLWPFWVRSIPRIDQRVELEVSSNTNI
ncbi:MAG: baseplate J/gp47 family protein [Candidatus Andersenbacteria bacterium]